MVEDNALFFLFSLSLFFWLLEAIGSNTCSLLNCKDYWNRPYKDVSRAVFLSRVTGLENRNSYLFFKQ